MKKNSVIKGVAAIGNEGIKKHFKTAETWQPLFELVWNGFDAAATNVSVDLVQNGMHGIERVVVKDDGHGSDFNTLNDTFGSFNDSAKKANLALKGGHGRGRLAFHRLCRNVSWFTRSGSQGSKAGPLQAHYRQYCPSKALQEGREAKGKPRSDGLSPHAVWQLRAWQATLTP